MTFTAAFLALLLSGGGPAPKVIPFERETGANRAEIAGGPGSRASGPMAEIVRKEKRAAIIARLGERPTGGYGIRIERVTRSGDQLTVTARVSEPGPDAIVTQAFTFPLDVVWVRAPAVEGVKPPIVLKLVDANGRPLPKKKNDAPRTTTTRSTR